MNDPRRQHQRIQKSLTLKFCLADVYPLKWDMSTVENISAGGVKFNASSDLYLNNKRIRMQIRLPEMVPDVLEVEALVLTTELLFNGKSSVVRARFLNLTETDKHNLKILENIINANLKK